MMAALLATISCAATPIHFEPLPPVQGFDA